MWFLKKTLKQCDFKKDIKTMWFLKKTLKQCGFSTKVNVAPGEQSLSGWPLLAPDIAPVPVAAREPGHLLPTEPGQLHPPLSATPCQSDKIWASGFRYLLNDSRPS